jgi:hypothetical protein
MSWHWKGYIFVQLVNCLVLYVQSQRKVKTDTNKTIGRTPIYIKGLETRKYLMIFVFIVGLTKAQQYSKVVYDCIYMALIFFFKSVIINVHINNLNVWQNDIDIGKIITVYLELGSNISISTKHGKISSEEFIHCLHPRGMIGCIRILSDDPLDNVIWGVRIWNSKKWYKVYRTS